MSALFWNSEVRVIGEGTTIGDVKVAIRDELSQRGFQDVRVNSLEVAGGKNGVWLSIAHLRIEPTRFWEVVIGSGDSFDITKSTVGEIAEELRRFQFV
jgi:hypothetical protein